MDKEIVATFTGRYSCTLPSASNRRRVLEIETVENLNIIPKSPHEESSPKALQQNTKIPVPSGTQSSISRTSANSNVMVSQDASTAKVTDTLSLCSALNVVTMGTHQRILVSGIYTSGSEDSFLYYPDCDKSEAMTWIEFHLKSRKYRKYLDQLIEKNGSAFVQFEGELYGPPAPDPALPEEIRRTFLFGWGHLGHYQTQLIVHRIKQVSPAPTHSPNMMSKR